MKTSLQLLVVTDILMIDLKMFISIDILRQCASMMTKRRMCPVSIHRSDCWVNEKVWKSIDAECVCMCVCVFLADAVTLISVLSVTRHRHKCRYNLVLRCFAFTAFCFDERQNTFYKYLKIDDAIPNWALSSVSKTTELPFCWHCKNGISDAFYFSMKKTHCFVLAIAFIQNSSFMIKICWKKNDQKTIPLNYLVESSMIATQFYVRNVAKFAGIPWSSLWFECFQMFL